MFIEIIDGRTTGAWSETPQDWATFEVANLPEKDLRFYKVVNNELVYDNQLELNFVKEDIKEREIEQLKNYLRETDWYSVREAETGKPMPEDVRTARQSARDRISELNLI